MRNAGDPKKNFLLGASDEEADSDDAEAASACASLSIMRLSDGST